MSEIIKEYGRVFVSVLIALFVLAMVLYTLICITEYMDFFSDLLMGV